MADIELMIKIPEEEYIRICDEPCTELGCAIRNGTPLNEVLDKIKAEIAELKPHSHYTQEMKNKVLEIVDKYRGEQCQP